jgi:hypothetical protein
MKRLIVVITTMLVLSFDANSQSTGDTTKMPGNYLKQLLDQNDSLRSLTDSLTAKFAHVAVVKTAEDVTAFSLRLSTYVLLFGLLLIAGFLFFLYKIQKGIGNFAFQLIGLVIVVVAALFVIVTGYDRDQITPIVGLLGTIVGFIFGSNTNNREDKPKPGI